MTETFATFQVHCDKNYEKTVLGPAMELKARIEKEKGVDLGKVALPMDAGTTATVTAINGSDLVVGWVGTQGAVVTSHSRRHQP